MLRARAYFSDNETIEKLKLEAAQKLDSLEAGKGAAKIILGLLAKWQKYDDQIDELFNNRTVEPGLSHTKKKPEASDVIVTLVKSNVITAIQRSE